MSGDIAINLVRGNNIVGLVSDTMGSFQGRQHDHLSVYLSRAEAVRLYRDSDFHCAHHMFAGDIITFLPETFTGVVHLRTKKGAITVLPALAGCVRVVKHSDTETLFIVESPRDPAPDTSSESNRETALCELTSRRGNVIIGLRGRDRHEPSVGLWQKLSNFFSG